MKKIVFFIIVFQTLPLLASNGQEWRTNAITDPAISSRCQVLIEKREVKLGQKQRIIALIQRAEQLIEKTPLEKKTIKERVEGTKRLLVNEQNYTLTLIQRLEEDIIRQGCPGISI